MVIVVNPPSLLYMVVLYKMSLNLQCLLINSETGSPSFYLLSNLEFDSLIHLGNWLYFNCLLLLMHIRLKI